MAEISSPTWSTTDSSNTATPPDGWPEGQAPSTVNDVGRMMMGAIKRFWNRINPAPSSAGSSNAYTLTYSPALSAYVDGEIYSFRASFANTGAATLNINGIGAKTIKKYESGAKADLDADDIVSGQPVQVAYDGTDMVLLSFGAAVPKPIESFVIACSDETTAITSGTGKVSFRMPYAFTLTEIPRAMLVTAQSSGSIFTVDINEAGSSILSTKLTIDNGETTSTTAVTAAVLSNSSLADDALMTVDVDQIGAGDAKGLKVALIGRRT